MENTAATTSPLADGELEDQELPPEVEALDPRGRAAWHARKLYELDAEHREEAAPFLAELERLSDLEAAIGGKLDVLNETAENAQRFHRTSVEAWHLANVAEGAKQTAALPYATVKLTKASAAGAMEVTDADALRAWCLTADAPGDLFKQPDIKNAEVKKRIVGMVETEPTDDDAETDDEKPEHAPGTLSTAIDDNGETIPGVLVFHKAPSVTVTIVKP